MPDGPFRVPRGGEQRRVAPSYPVPPGMRITRQEHRSVAMTGSGMTGRTVATSALLALTLLPGGCSEKEEPPKHRPLEGTIKRIDLASSEVTLRYYSDKHGVETELTGKVTADTEIFINGVLETLSDLREGERVTVSGWVKGHGDAREVVAAKIMVDRAETIRRKPDQQPTAGGDKADAGQTDKHSEKSAAAPPPAKSPDGDE